MIAINHIFKKKLNQPITAPTRNWRFSATLGTITTIFVLK